ncbi:hypothetical protein HMPREF3196_00029 [Bifidobacterium bifidum]|uniref:Uncharacterized protein n=1 Tax=Bifidobacterium bifidum TaxID=1681 RepID=A0A133KUY5_BIFBI|nr:hypothetical protein BIFBIF_00124 [Bifidobacterium bifidum ATCC 29521 = JCM 1255 = DSM 20456]KWZ83140.1 hypothetical protein HMPREF3196_00029 [Bifidobacterium bifidum]
MRSASARTGRRHRCHRISQRNRHHDIRNRVNAALPPGQQRRNPKIMPSWA